MTVKATSLEDMPPGTYCHSCVPEKWIDYNGHMNVGGYFEIFDLATDPFFDSLGLDQAYLETRGFTTFTGEFHIRYIAEVKLGEKLKITSRILGFDAKRIHLYQEMHVDEEGGRLAAACEHMVLHIRLDGPSVAPMPPDRLKRVEEVFRIHVNRFDPPQHANRMIKTPGV